MIQLSVGQQTLVLDPVKELRGSNNYGTFFCQLGGQSFLAISEQGQSVTSFTAIGTPIPEAQPQIGAARRQWIVQKLSNQILSMEEASERTRSAGGND